MGPVNWFLILFVLVGIISTYRSTAQTTPARSLDALLQGYAYRALKRPLTGFPYDGQVPSNLTGVEIAVLRLRSGSLRIRGVQRYKEFQIPPGVVAQPYVERLAFVYQNLGNWSTFYYPLPGYTYLTPMLGFLAYNAANLSGTNLPELQIVASGSAISINFTNVRPVPSGAIAQCVWFGLDGLPEFGDLVSSSVCSTYRQGHFSIVANSTGPAPVPAPATIPGTIPAKSQKSKSHVWKIVGGVIGGFVVLILLALILVCMIRYRQNRNVAEMERRAELGEPLHMSRVGNAQAPVALGTRTQPILENEYAA